jgi:hypothetical protein
VFDRGVVAVLVRAVFMGGRSVDLRDRLVGLRIANVGAAAASDQTPDEEDDDKVLEHEDRSTC